jgi:hypothetical protein
VATDYWTEWEHTLETWTDERHITRKDLDTMVRFELQLLNLLADRGLDYRGESFKYGTPMSLLVVKVYDQRTAKVAFVNGRHRVECARIFLRKLLEDRVNWQDDKFA